MVVGQVKWFNAKAGFGFVSVGSEDVFVHHSEIQVGKEQFRYLVEGEYVELTVTKKAGEEKRQGSGIRGIGGGRVMCEVRAAAAEATSEYKGVREAEVRERVRVGSKAGPRANVEEEKEKVGGKRVGGVKRSTSVVQQLKHKPEAELE
jgi:cold shock CspA family protein